MSLPPTSSQSALINSNVMFVLQSMPMQEAVALMIDQKISSLLVLDTDDNVVGILTERDIVHKFTLLDMADKLTRTVGTMMTRPVHFVQLKNLRSQITKLHLEHKFRHFPVISGEGHVKSNVVGIVSITDLARQHMSAAESTTQKNDDEAPSEKALIGILTSQRPLTQTYRDLFQGLGFNTLEVSDVHKFLKHPEANHRALIFDMDGFSDLRLHELIPVVVKSKCYLILTTSQANLVPTFKKYVNKTHQDIAMKPIDLSYLSWMLTRKWQIHNPNKE